MCLVDDEYDTVYTARRVGHGAPPPLSETTPQKDNEICLVDDEYGSIKRMLPGTRRVAPPLPL